MIDDVKLVAHQETPTIQNYRTAPWAGELHVPQPSKSQQQCKKASVGQQRTLTKGARQLVVHEALEMMSSECL